jgi:hypothetical protein
MPKGFGDLLGGAHLEFGIEASTLSGIREHPAGTMTSVRTAGSDAEYGETSIATGTRSVAHGPVFISTEPSDDCEDERGAS